VRCSSVALQADGVLRARGDPGLHVLARLLAAGGFLYGAVMGSYGGPTLQIIYAGFKVPLLVVVSTIVCLPSFWVLHLLLGLREDFREAVLAVLAGQATLALCLAALAPLTVVGYLSIDSYRLAVLGNGVPFLLATIGAQVTMTRHYRRLVARRPRHALTRNAWLALYVFVAVQAAWVLRPFVGAPGLPVSFFREEAWDNAYVRVFRAIVG